MHHSSMKMIMTSLIALSILPSCADKSLETPGIAYKNSGPIMLNVNSVQVVSVPSVHTSKSKHIQEANKMFRQEVEKWAHSRIGAQGGEDRAVLTITKANIRLLREHGNQTDDYEGKVEVRLDILDDRGFVKGTVSAIVDQIVSIPETYTVYENRAQVKRLGEEVINALDAKMIKEISQHMMSFTAQ